MPLFSISGQLVDLHRRCIYPAIVSVKDGVIVNIQEISVAPSQYIMPGFIDAHVHIESSMLVPTAFARMAVVHGTVASISDPHEIANVCGLEGVRYMIDNARQTPFKCFFGAPSCVPATDFETAGATITATEIDTLLQWPDIWYLTEMMNYPGVLNEDDDVMNKIAAAKKWNKPIDGHAPGLMDELAKKYAAAGITTDHECFTLEEALGKIQAGMKILIREGSAARNFEALHSLLALHPDKVMFCSDDKHPDDLALHHINDLVKRSLDKGYELFDVLRAACVHPVAHYKVPVGLLRIGEAADFIIVSDLHQFNILQTFISGKLVAERGRSLLPVLPANPINQFSANRKNKQQFQIAAMDCKGELQVMEALDGQLITRAITMKPNIVNGFIEGDISQDILKITVVNRYEADAKPAIAFIKNFGLQRGAIASTVAHDCHNIICVGADDESICAAVNKLIEMQGGIVVVNSPHNIVTMPLPIAGLMTDKDGYEIAQEYAAIDEAAKALGTKLRAPFMTLSFMALLVIPSLKLSDKGLFDGERFKFVC